MIDLKKFIFIVPIAFRNKILILVILSILGALFEVVGIGLVFPAITLITSQDGNFYGYNFRELFLSTPFSDDINFTEFVFICLFFIFFIKFCFFLFLTWYQATFIEKMSTSISKRLFKNYILADYSFYFGKNSEELMRNVISESGIYIKKIFIPTIQTIMDALILTGILILLFLVDVFSSAILISIYLIFVITYIFSIKKKLIQIGSQQLEFDKLKIKSSQEAFFGIKTIKIFLKESEFINRYIFNYKKIAYLSKITSFIQQIPKYSIELLTIFSFIILSLILLRSNNNFVDIVPTLALFMAAAFRLVPSINRITTNNQLIKTGIATQNNLYKELKIHNYQDNIDENIDKNFLFNKLEIVDLSFSYKENINILENLNIQINKGDIIGIVGKTGSGKSTLIDLIVGLIKATNGKILINEKKISDLKRSWKGIIGYVPQETFMLNDSIKANVVFMSKKETDENYLDYCLRASKVYDFLENKLDTAIGEKGITLSGGQKQRIGIARALYNNPQIIIFDEATNALDESTEKSILNSIYKLRKSKTMILISHNRAILKECDKIFEIKNKKLFQIK